MEGLHKCGVVALWEYCAAINEKELEVLTGEDKSERLR